MPIFQAQSLTAGYKNRGVIKDCSFSLDAGSITGILGANGSGKTTLIKAVCGNLPHKGTCTLDGTALETLSARQLSQVCGYIPQRSGIQIDIPVIDVVLMGFHASLGLLERPTESMRRAAVQVLAEVGLDGFAERNYQKLSEGQKQLCILARTLVCDRRLLLLDEPESALDYAMRHRTLDLLRTYIRRTNGCALIALHDPVLALNACDRLLFLQDGTTVGSVSPMTDAPETTERLLRMIYGDVRLLRVEEQWVLLRDETKETTS